MSISHLGTLTIHNIMVDGDFHLLSSDDWGRVEAEVTQPATTGKPYYRRAGGGRSESPDPQFGPVKVQEREVALSPRPFTPHAVHRVIFTVFSHWEDGKEIHRYGHVHRRVEPTVEGDVCLYCGTLVPEGGRQSYDCPHCGCN